ncbi:alpha/beta fold hydrolase [Nonomuraea glycinis]|uniref:Alpha/beta hydrolase n=1 Tax=Nonomuraea glycinis TaxID=2047744 RepID=A0A918E1H9_9ACTN|nr:alpha/beta fold hydrolase [Nonomuraea glycinis]MCA2175065.1 alpha/beta fold hydrolase [Nonomuraea glycinis]GGP00955.1 alpha/beta hydrolase [Nonomuraea glycinis]
MPFAPHFPVLLRTEDGVRIDAAHTDPTGPSGRDVGIVVAHGFTGSWRERTARRIAHVLSRYGGVVAFDFRGHGRSGGESTVGDREILDVDAAVRHARVIGYRKIAVVGFSMGASVAVRHGGLCEGADAVVAVSGPARWYYRGTKPMRQVHWAIERPVGRWAARVAKRTRIAARAWEPIPMPPHEAVALISPAPVLIVHGDADAFFPLDHPHQLYDGAREPKELWIEPGYGHAEAAATPELIHRIGKWISSNFS